MKQIGENEKVFDFIEDFSSSDYESLYENDLTKKDEINALKAQNNNLNLD